MPTAFHVLRTFMSLNVSKFIGLKPTETISNHFKPFQTISNHFKQFQTTSNHFKQSQTISNYFKQLQTTSKKSPFNRLRF